MALDKTTKNSGFLYCSVQTELEPLLKLTRWLQQFQLSHQIQPFRGGRTHAHSHSHTIFPEALQNTSTEDLLA